jgi:hypothetical protein
MKVSRHDMEEILIALLRHKDSEGRLTGWGTVMSGRIQDELSRTGRVLIQVEEKKP